MALKFGVNVGLTPEDVYEVRLGATVDEGSISVLCEKSADALHPNSIRDYLREKFDGTAVECTGTRWRN